MRVLRRAYAEQLTHRLTQIEKAVAALGRSERQSALRSVRMMAHSLAGSAAIFGFRALSECARDLSGYLSRAEGDARPVATEGHDLVQLLEALRAACMDVEATEQLPPEQDDDDRDRVFEPARSRRLIFLVTRNSALAADLSFQLGCFGYLVRSFADCREPLERLDEGPAALIVDAEPFSPLIAETREVSDHLRRCEMSVPILLLSVRSDLSTRLEAVRARVDAFLSSPPNIRRLVERLESFTNNQPIDPYRVLVVQDDYQRALSLSLALQRSGMTAVIATQPDRALKELVDFQPDLVLLSVALPDVTGPELAAIIRQSEAYVHIPIVFLAGGVDVDGQLELMRSGADDLITEPIDLRYVLSAVGYHAQRSRSLRYFLSHDSLTGVLNHTEFMQRLEAEFEQAVRYARPISYAMIDLDNLRAINERYGYLTGDGVIKSLSGLLTQRLRKTDIIGRYGGEEFGIIMPDTPGNGARRVLDEIRALFSELPQQSSEGAFYGTYSAGLASLPGYDLAIELHEAARRALTLAGRHGRNRVVLVKD